MNQRSIALVGLSGTGKSTVGRALAAASGMTLVDVDMRIEARAGLPIPAIFREQGEAAFRQIETEALQAALEGGKPRILATGAGMVLRNENRVLLREHAIVVWLDAPTETLVARLQAHDEERPLLQGDDMLARLDHLRAIRAPLYAEIANLRIETHEHAISEIVAKILEAV